MSDEKNQVEEIEPLSEGDLDSVAGGAVSISRGGESDGCPSDGCPSDGCPSDGCPAY